MENNRDRWSKMSQKAKDFIEEYTGKDEEKKSNDARQQDRIEENNYIQDSKEDINTRLDRGMNEAGEYPGYKNSRKRNEDYVNPQNPQ